MEERAFQVPMAGGSNPHLEREPGVARPGNSRQANEDQPSFPFTVSNNEGQHILS